MQGDCGPVCRLHAIARTGRWLAADYHCQIDRDPARIVTGATRTQPMEGVAEGMGQSGGFGEISQKAGPGMADHPTPVGRDDEPGT